MKTSPDSPSVKSLPDQKFLEDHLDMTVRDVLPIMQARAVDRTTYFGIQTIKDPIDFWIYQELIVALQPDVIVEIGNFYGGMLLALAHLCDALGKGRVVGIDLDHAKVPATVRTHSRIALIQGDAVEKFSEVRRKIDKDETVLVIEDSSHTRENTLAVLRAYCDLVSVGSYFIVEDGICHHGLEVGPSPGPYEAVTEFIESNPNFMIDRTCESFFLTWNPRGYLRRTQ
jgi:cephalosporin hydroxylase